MPLATLSVLALAIVPPTHPGAHGTKACPLTLASSGRQRRCSESAEEWAEPVWCAIGSRFLRQACVAQEPGLPPGWGGHRVLLLGHRQATLSNLQDRFPPPPPAPPAHCTWRGYGTTAGQSDRARPWHKRGRVQRAPWSRGSSCGGPTAAFAGKSSPAPRSGDHLAGGLDPRLARWDTRRPARSSAKAALCWASRMLQAGKLGVNE